MFVVFVVLALACVAGTWKEWAKERTGAHEGDTRGVSPSRAPVFSCAHYLRAPVTQAMLALACVACAAILRVQIGNRKLEARTHVRARRGKKREASSPLRVFPSRGL